MPVRTDARIAQVLERYALVVAVTVVLFIPVFYWFLAQQTLADRLAVVAETKAEAASRQAASNPGMWVFEELRLTELLGRNPTLAADEYAQIRDWSGRVIASYGKPPDMAIERAAKVHDSGRVVAWVEVSASLRSALENTALVAVVGLLLGYVIFAVMRQLPLRALRRATDALHEEKERAEVTLKAISDAVFTVDARGNIEYANAAVQSLLGIPVGECRGRAIQDIMTLVDDESNQPVENPMQRALASGANILPEDNTTLTRRDGSRVAVENSAAVIRDTEGAIVGGVLVVRDVTVSRHFAQSMSWQARHDSLTGLVNRREFENRAEAALMNTRRSGSEHVLCYMDLDQFKVVNDTCGHSAGDRLLKDIADLLQSKIRASDTLSRLGGDEFGLLLASCPMDNAQRIAADLIAAVRDFRFTWNDKVFTVGMSIGLARLGAGYASAADALVAADTACYRAKDEGRNRVCVHASDEPGVEQPVNQASWVARINQAMEQGRFRLYYQKLRPLDEAQTCRHIEVLLRLVDERGNLVLPGSFLPAAERYKLMPAIDRWVIHAVFSNYRFLAEQLGAGLTCAVNLSGASIDSPELVEYIRAEARACALPRHAVCFEITETSAMNNLRKVTRFIEQVRETGFLFALDDFGTASSSFGYLKQLPVDYLKIDGAFVKDLERDPVDRAMAEAINRIGHIMGLKTIAEYAENEAILEGLKQMGVDFAQGYAVNRPEPLPIPGPLGTESAEMAEGSGGLR